MVVIVVVVVVQPAIGRVYGRIEEDSSNGSTRRMKQTPCQTTLADWFEVTHFAPSL